MIKENISYRKSVIADIHGNKQKKEIKHLAA